MDTKKASEWAQILSLPFGAYSAYAVWLSRSSVQGQESQTGPMMSRFVSSTALLIAFGAFAGLLLLSVVLLALSRRTQKEAIQKTKEPTRLPYPTVMIFRHEEARQKDQPTFHQITDRFAHAGWRVEGATTNLPQHARGVRIRGGTSFEREMAKWGLDGLGIAWQLDDTGEPPHTLQVVVGVYEAVHPRETEQAALSPIRVLERFYMALAHLRDDVGRIVWLDKEMDKKSDLYPMESALEKIRAELMNLSPTIFSTATALDFQKGRSESGYVEPSVRLPKAIDELMKTVARHWGRHAEKVGITPIGWNKDPIVKLQDE